MVDVNRECAHWIIWVLRDDQLPPGAVVAIIALTRAAAAITIAATIATMTTVHHAILITARVWPSHAPLKRIALKWFWRWCHVVHTSATVCTVTAVAAAIAATAAAVRTTHARTRGRTKATRWVGAIVTATARLVRVRAHFSAQPKQRGVHDEGEIFGGAQDKEG